MTKIYQLMVNGKQKNGLYYNEEDAIENAKQIAEDLGLIVEIWEAEEIEGVPADELKWATLITVRSDKLNEIMQTERFVITYGTSPKYPYEGGYSTVYAKDMETARKMHAQKYGYTIDGCLRFAFIYTTEQAIKYNCEVGKLNSILIPKD